MRNRRTTLAVSAAAAALVLSACGGSSDEPVVEEDAQFEAGTTMAELAAAGSITIGTKFDQPLFGLVGPSGEPEGFDVEIGKIVAAGLGIEASEIEWVETVSANRETFISDGQVDIVIATYTINDERKEVIDFAGPYYTAGQMLMVLEENDTINSPEDLAGTQVCTVEGSTPFQNIADNFPEANLIPGVGGYADCLDPLRSGQADVLTTDNVILSGYVDQNEGEFKLVGEQFTEEPYGIGLAQGDDEFREFINATLEESYEDGEWAAAWERTAGAVLDTPEPPAVDRYASDS